MSEELNKYGSLCSHDFHKSLTNEIELSCNVTPNLSHKISQFGKICNKCTQIIKDSYKNKQNCIVCSDTIQQYLADRELCQHQNREFEDISIKCLNESAVSHSVPFKTQVCKRCSDKLRASFMNNKICKVCEGKENQVVRDMEKAFISPAFSHFKNVISILKQAGASEEVFKNQIESACQSQPRVVRKSNGLISSKMTQEYNSSDKEDYHQSKRYKLYPKCRKHKDNCILVCNLCLVALLNLDTCAYGCEEQSKEGLKIKKDTQIKFSETGFLVPYPQITKDTYYLELFVIKLIEERGRLDRWESTIRKVMPKTNLQARFIDRFPLYATAISVDSRNILVAGGVLGKHYSEMKPTNQAFVISLSADAKDFQIMELPPMQEARSGHCLIYHEERKMIFAVGGFVRGVGYSKTTEVYSMEAQVWYKLGDLNVERSRPTPICYKDGIYVFGGLTSSYGMLEAHGQKFNYDTRQWQKLAYNGYDYPPLSDSTASTSLLPFRKKNNILLFGGGNSTEANPLVQSLSISQKEFGLNDEGKYFKLNYARFGCTLGIIGEDTLIIFGGLEQHESLLSIEALKLRVTETEISPLFVMDEVQVGSYRLSLRENAESTYKRLYDQLQSSGLMNGDKFDSQEKDLSSAFNCQLLERMYYSVGKNFVWVPL